MLTGGGSGGSIQNGDVITITGSGFGNVAPTVLLWDTVDNNGDVYDSLPDGSLVPLVGSNADAVYYDMAANGVTLESDGAFSGDYGQRNRVYAMKNGASFLGLPKNASDVTTQSNTKLYARFYLRDDGNPFAGGQNKFFRTWDSTSDQFLHISASNSQLWCDDPIGGSFSIADSFSGYCPDDTWMLCELWVDMENGELATRYFNIDTHSISDESIHLVNPDALGINLSLFGYDDGNADSAGRSWLMSDVYLANSRARVELCSAPDPKRALYREIQQVTEWSDTSIKFTMDALRIDPANCWAVVLDENEDVLVSYKIGDPIEITQNIRRPMSTNSRPFALSGISTTDGNFEFECEFLIRPASETTLTNYKFAYDGGYSNRINYDLASGTWQFRSGYGTAADSITSISGGWDDDLIHSLKVVANAVAGTVDIYVDGVIDGSASGLTINAFVPTQIGYTVGSSLDGSATGYIWNLKVTDLTTPSNSHYWKFDEQVRPGHKIYDYAQDRFAGTDVSAVVTYDYLPGEGY